MQLVIAEKPSVARDVARVLGMRGSGRHALSDASRVITWCIGHLVELDEPVAYDPRWKAWRLDALPMIPAVFKLRPVERTRDQLEAVRKLLRDRRFSEVVNACDAGREGELIFRYVYELAESRLPVRRLWISSMTDESIRRGFATLRSGADYDALADAARCRSEADWLVGLNATRAVTVTQRVSAPGRPAPSQPLSPSTSASARAGVPAQWERSPVYSIGRVQTPTLAIVVRREQSILAFRPQDYWEVRATFNPLDDAPGSDFAALWETRGERGKVGITRFAHAELAESVVERARLAASAPKRDGGAGGGGAVVERLRQKKSREPAPQLFDLTSLQRTANRRFGSSATRTLEAAQSLYEKHKLLTYPRTDSRHLTLDLLDELPRLFRGAAQLPDYAPYAQFLMARPTPRSKRIFDDAKVQDHHAIIPTGKGGSLEALSLDERRVFDLVMRRFLGAFYPDAEFALTAVVVRVGEAEPLSVLPPGELAADLSQDPAEVGFASNETMLQALPPPPDRFFARGRVRLVAGWQEVAQIGGVPRPSGARADAARAPDADGEAAASTLPMMVEGQRLRGTFETVAKQTKPPPRHTEASLLGAMESAGRDIEDEALRAAMKDTGLGTPATRAATIETLVKRVFITRNGKQLVPTHMGMALIDTLPVASLASPELTGAWEARLARIARRQETRASFMLDIARYVGEMVDSIRRAPFDPRGGPVGTRRSSHVGAAAVVVTPATVSTAIPPATRLNEPARGSAARQASPAKSSTALACPRCTEGTLVRGKRGWGCSRWRLGCPFVVWFETAGRKLTDVELRDLVQKGKTRKARWSPAGGPTISGRLVLDMTVSPPSGAGRFQPA